MVETMHVPVVAGELTVAMSDVHRPELAVGVLLIDISRCNDPLSKHQLHSEGCGGQRNDRRLMTGMCMDKGQGCAW